MLIAFSLQVNELSVWHWREKEWKEKDVQCVILERTYNRSFARLDGKTVRMQDAFFLISSRECARPPLLPQTE